MLRIRLRRTGRKNRPSYRIVVAEHSAPLTGKFVDQLGHFDPRTKELGLDTERVLKWLNVGAQPSNRVAKLLKSLDVKHKLVVVTTKKPRAPKNAPEEVVVAATPAAAESEAPAVAETAEPTKPEEVEVTEEPAAEAPESTPEA